MCENDWSGFSWKPNFWARCTYLLQHVSNYCDVVLNTFGRDVDHYHILRHGVQMYACFVGFLIYLVFLQLNDCKDKLYSKIHKNCNIYKK